MAAVYLQRKRKKRLEQGQPWIFQNEVDRVEGEPQEGSLVSVHSHIGQFLAVGYYNPKSQIVVRVVSYKPLEAMTKAFFLWSGFNNAWHCEPDLLNRGMLTGLFMAKRIFYRV